MRRRLNLLTAMPGQVLFAAAITMVALIGIVDWLTGYEISFSIFYLIPILLAAWYVGRAQAVMLSFMSAGAWLAAEIATGHVYSHPAIPVWNALSRFGIFLVVAFSLSATKRLLAMERERARTDYLTGAANARCFYERARNEIDRSVKLGKPVTLAFIDIDNFRAVNDLFGHSVGDRLLKTAAHALNTTLLPTDTISRLGGDEFAIFLPERGYDEAALTVSAVQANLAEAMRANEWPVTFSIGVVTCCGPMCTLEDLVRMADGLMHAAKADGKNKVIHKVHESATAGELTAPVSGAMRRSSRGSQR